MTSSAPGGASSWPRWRTACAAGPLAVAASRRSTRSSARSAGAVSASWGCRRSGWTTIVGTTSARRDFDRCFRPASSQARFRWERLALAQRRGEAIPPIEVYRLGGLHFVSDGHHRVSIAAASGQPLIDAYVTQVLTTVPPKAETSSPACWR